MDTQQQQERMRLSRGVRRIYNHVHRSLTGSRILSPVLVSRTTVALYNAPPNLGEPQKDPTHTSNFGVKLKEHCESTGTVCELIHLGAKSSNIQLRQIS